MPLFNHRPPLNILLSNSSSKTPKYHLRYEIRDFDTLFNFDWRVSVMLKAREIEYDRVWYMSEHAFEVLYIIYG